MELLIENISCLVPLMFLVRITIYLFYQQAGDAKNPYLAQYSAVVEDSPVITSWISMKINILIKNIPKPLNTHFNTFLIEFFLASVDNIIKDIESCSI
jgi:hypothetical protein